MSSKVVFLSCLVLIAALWQHKPRMSAGSSTVKTAAGPMQEPPPTPTPTPAEDAERYVAWMAKQGKPISDRPHENVTLRIGEWGFFYHGDRPPGSWQPLRDKTALDRSGHAVTESENSDWYGLLSTGGLDAAGALKRVAWLFNAEGLDPASAPTGAGRDKITAPTLTAKEGTIRFQGWLEYYTDPPYSKRIIITATTAGAKVLIGP